MSIQGYNCDFFYPLARQFNNNQQPFKIQIELVIYLKPGLCRNIDFHPAGISNGLYKTKVFKNTVHHFKSNSNFQTEHIAAFALHFGKKSQNCKFQISAR